jgi:hypothetical protein
MLPISKERKESRDNGERRWLTAGAAGKQSCALPLELPHPVILLPRALSHVLFRRRLRNNEHLCVRGCVMHQGVS